MTKKIWFFPFMIIILTFLAGCGGGSSPSDYRETKQGAAQLIANFESAVESYNVSAMLGCLSGDDFNLTIWEAGHTVTKPYSQLQTELKADEANQLAWRQPITELDGHAYVLDLVLGGLSYSNTTSAGTYAKQTFQVWEQADGIPLAKTDNGTITWKIIKRSGQWKAVEMTINYEALSGSGLSAMRVAGSSKGFGFTKLFSR